MKSIYAVITACAMVSMASCGLCANKKAEDNAASRSADTIAVTTMDLSTGHATMEMSKDSAQTVMVTFDSPGSEVLYARLVLPTDSVGNVGNLRFNQIIMSDSSADGPFGREMVYELSDSGTYTLSIGESLMQGDPYNDNFIVELHSGVKVPYETAANYFVRNDVDTSAVKTVKITSKEEFDKFFGMATTMKSKPTPIDLSKQFAIAVIGKPTDTADQYEVSALLKKGDSSTLVYRMIKGEKQTYTSRPFLLMTVDKQFDSTTLLFEPMV